MTWERLQDVHPHPKKQKNKKNPTNKHIHRSTSSFKITLSQMDTKAIVHSVCD